MERISTLRFECIQRFLSPFFGVFLISLSLNLCGTVLYGHRYGYGIAEEAAVIEAVEANRESAEDTVDTKISTNTDTSWEPERARLAALRPQFETLVPRVPSLIATLSELPWPEENIGENNVVQPDANGKNVREEDVRETDAAWTVTGFGLLSGYLQNPEARALDQLRNWVESQREDESLSSDQRRFLGALQRRFPIWEGVVAGDTECRRLSQLIERIEWNLPEQSEQEFLATIAAMTRSEVPTTRIRGEQLSKTWCAPNFRTTVSLELFRHLIPPRRQNTKTSSEYYGAFKDYGQDPEIRVVLIPNEERAYLRLETTGSLLSLPESTSPGQFRLTTGDSKFHAWKDIQVTGNGVELLPTQAEILDHSIFGIPSGFSGFAPQFNGSPESLLSHDLFGNPSPLANLQITRDLRRAIERDREATLDQAKQYLDHEGEQRIGTIRQRIEDRLLEPLQEMKLGPMVRSASTTEDQAFFSLGLRTSDQCGGYTPVVAKPSSDALLAIQIHESTFNNLIRQMGFGGSTASLLEIQNRVALRFNSPELLMAEPSDGRFVIAFPEKDALQIQTKSDQTIQITLRATEFTDQYEGTTWNDLEVRANYRIVLTPEELRLERTEPIQLRGSELSGESQLRLRAIFGRIFGREGYSAIRPGDIFSIETLQSLRFLSARIHDGWIQLELGQMENASEDGDAQGDVNGNTGENSGYQKVRRKGVWGEMIF